MNARPIAGVDTSAGCDCKSPSACRVFGRCQFPDGVAPVEAPSYTYASTQATNCARCGKHKHTPLRVDRMDGYVCLTCIDEELERLLDDEAERTAGVPESDNAALIAAAETYADNYEGESIPAQDVRASIQNAFFAGSTWAGKACVPVVDSETLQRTHVICCNDTVMHVHLGDEDSAREKLEELALADYNRNHWTWDYQSRTYGVGKTKDDGYAYYRKRCYWHIHTVPVTT